MNFGVNTGVSQSGRIFVNNTQNVGEFLSLVNPSVLQDQSRFVSGPFYLAEHNNCGPVASDLFRGQYFRPNITTTKSRISKLNKENASYR